jgi:hypothetical protein
MSDKYQLSPPSVFFEADIKSLPDKGFGVSSWPGYTTTVIFTQCFRTVKKPETYYSRVRANSTHRPISLNNQDKVENYLKPMKNQGFQPFSRILLVEKALSKFGRYPSP